jgi:hypothetical protein
MRIDGVLRADGPEGSVIIDGKGREVNVTIEGRPPRPSRSQFARLARFARDRDLLVTVSDERGAPLAELGGATSSILGRILLGTRAARPRLGALKTLIRPRR